MTPIPQRPQAGSPLTVKALCEKLAVPAPEHLSDRLIDGIATLDRATEHNISFVLKEKHVPTAVASRALLVLAPMRLPIERDGLLRTKDPMGGVLTVLEHFHPDPTPTGNVHPTAVVSRDATLGIGVQIDAHVVIEDGANIGEGSIIGAGSFIGADATLGKNCIIAPRVTIHHRTQIGDRVRVYSGAVIGGDGYRFEVARGRLSKIPQVGIVVLENDVEVGANCTIDRAFLNETRVGARTKIDNLVHVAHNVTIGTDCLIIAQVGIAGSCNIGNGVIIAGQTGIADHITINDRVRIGGKSGITSDIPAGSQLIGNPAIAPRDYARFTHFYRNISTYMKRMRSAGDEDETGDDKS